MYWACEVVVLQMGALARLLNARRDFLDLERHAHRDININININIIYQSIRTSNRVRLYRRVIL